MVLEIALAFAFTPASGRLNAPARAASHVYSMS